MLRLEVLLVAALVTAPALWAAIVQGSMPLDTALIRYLIAIPVCALGLALLRSVYGGYAATVPRRRRSDVEAGEVAEPRV